MALGLDLRGGALPIRVDMKGALDRLPTATRADIRSLMREKTVRVASTRAANHCRQVQGSRSA